MRENQKNWRFTSHESRLRPAGNMIYVAPAQIRQALQHFRNRNEKLLLIFLNGYISLKAPYQIGKAYQK